MPDRDLLHVDLETAVRLKYDRGRAKHGDKWDGHHPAEDLLGEIHDGLVYASLAMQTAARPAHEETLSEILRQLAELRRGTVTLLLSMTEDELNGWTLPGT